MASDRESRRSGEAQQHDDLAASPYRVDRDRIATSPFFARLAGVTQVVSPGGSLLHNRLTHSIRVAQVGRAVAERLVADETAAPVLDKLGGLDPDVVEAAALAHDLGHPPFGHLGEQVLDRLARTRFGLPDGFEGNAQSFRIITTTDSRGPHGAGLDLTAATRAAVLKYPWTRAYLPDPHPSAMADPPRGAREPQPGAGSVKFSVYLTELADLAGAREPFAGLLAPWQQTVEASVMDTADDIAYAIHDLEDFHRIGVLQYAPVAAELTRWSSVRDEERPTGPGSALELLRRRLHARDGWMVDDDAFADAVARVRAECVDGLLASPFDGSVRAEQAIGEFSRRWTARLVEGISVRLDPPTRSGHVLMAPAQWHEVQVLKFVHHTFVLRRADLAMHQRGQASVLASLIDALEQWVIDSDGADRLPRRLHDLVELAVPEYENLAAGHSGALDGGMSVTALARGRAVIDFVASLTDSQAGALLDALSGRAGQPWSDAYVL